MNDMQALRLLSDLWADLRDPDFIWQVSALLVCLGIAGFVARVWRSRGGIARRRCTRRVPGWLFPSPPWPWPGWP